MQEGNTKKMSLKRNAVNIILTVADRAELEAFCRPRKITLAGFMRAAAWQVMSITNRREGAV